MKSKRGYPGTAARLTAVILSLLMLLLLLGGMILTTVHGLLTNESFHLRVALNDRVIDMQAARMEEAVYQLADTYHFAPETVLQYLTRDSLEAYNRKMVAWWMGLFTGDSDPEAPVYSTSQIQTALRSDPLFQQHVEPDLRLHVARDQVGYQLSEEIRKAVMPLRMSLMQLALPIAMEQIDFGRLLSLIRLTGLLMLLSPLALAVVLLICTRSLRWLCACLSGVLLAAVMVLITLGILFHIAGIQHLVAGMSAALALQMRVFSEQAALRLGIVLLLMLTGGVLLSIPGQPRQRIRYVFRRHRKD